ncbi:MAG: helix-turn-helix domain-containing protein [Candidatus Coatesbacteria bacterium]|nr:helix-turn-helix domain-containing protein [Candidatus Coatesbacteria bacterium]
MNKIKYHEDDLLTTRTVANLLNVSVRTVQRLISERRVIPGWKIGGTLKVRYADVLKYLRRCKL